MLQLPPLSPIDGAWHVVDSSGSDNDWDSDDERAVPIASEGVHGRYIRFAQKNGLPYGDNAVGNVDTLSRWARVRTRRIEALTRRVTHAISAQSRTDRTVANDVNTAHTPACSNISIDGQTVEADAVANCANSTCAAEEGVVTACANVSYANEEVVVTTCANVYANENSSEPAYVDDNNVSVIEITDDDNDDVSPYSLGVDAIVNAEAVIEINVDDVGVSSGSAEPDTANTTDTVGVTVQSDSALVKSHVDPLSFDGSCSTNQTGGGGCDREVEQNVGVERESGSVASDDDDDDDEVRPPIQVRDIPNFNAFEMRQRLDFRDISLENPELVPMRIRERLSGVIDRALDRAQPGSILNVVLRGPSLANDVQAILNSDNTIQCQLFLEEISRFAE